MKLRKQFQLTVILLLAITAPATAQFTQNAQFAPFNILTRTSIPVVIQCPGCNAANRNNRTKTTKTTVTKTEIGKFSYNPSVTVRQRIVTRLAEDVRAKYPDAAEKIEQNFISNDIIGQMNKIMVTSGLNPNNLADAYAFYLANAWQAFSGRNENLSKTEIVAMGLRTSRYR